MSEDAENIMDQPLTFAEHKEQTAKDCESIAVMLTELAAKVREGNMAAFEQFWFAGGTEEGDAKIAELLDRLALRYVARQERVNKTKS